MHRYWILDRRAQTYFEIPMRSVLQYGMSLRTTCYASRRLAFDRYGVLNAIASNQHNYDKSRMLAVLSLILTKQKIYLMQNEAYQPKNITFPRRQFGVSVIVNIISSNLVWPLHLASISGKWFCILICMLQSCQRWKVSPSPNVERFLLINLVIVCTGIYKS